MKKIVTAILILCLLFGMAACGGGDDSSNGGGDASNGGESNVGDIVNDGEDSGVVDGVKKMLSSQGRGYDELFTGSQGETLTCAFFDFTITDAKAVDEFFGYTLNDENMKFITAEVAVKNVASMDIPVGDYDFEIFWESTEEIADEDHWAYEVLEDSTGMYPDEVTLAPGESANGTLLFSIPKDVNKFIIAYQEIYEDEFVGNTYAVECEL